MEIESADNSFDGQDQVDINFPIAESEEEDHHETVPVKKLSDMFDNCANNKDASFKVFLRVRPIPDKMESTIIVESETSIVTNAPESSKRAQYTKKEERKYTFHKIFGPDSNQEEVFTNSVTPLLEKYLTGESCVLFAYGMTNAGKTHTIQGSTSLPGILPKLVNAILERTSSIEDSNLHMSMLEIYQEKIFDLMGQRKDKLTIRDGSGKVEVMKLSAHPIQSGQDAVKLLATAAANRFDCYTKLLFF